MVPDIVGIPIKPFGVAKARLSPALDAKQRSALGRAIAARTASTIALSGAVPVVVTADQGVSRWAKSLNLDVIPEALSPPGASTGLDRAAHAVVERAGSGSWAIVHADLPLATDRDFTALWRAAETHRFAIAPSHDAGTNAIVGTGAFTFRYGAGSFVRHLASVPRAAVVRRPGLAYDLDTPLDLSTMRNLASAGWLRTVLTIIEASPGSGS